MDRRSIRVYINDAIDKMANNPYGATSQLNTRLAIEKLKLALKEVDKYQIELAGKEAVIRAIEEDISYYRKDRKDQMIQDQDIAE